MKPSPFDYRRPDTLDEAIALLAQHDGNAQAKGSEPDDLFNVTSLVKGAEAAGPVEDSGCKMTWPA